MVAVESITVRGRGSAITTQFREHVEHRLSSGTSHHDHLQRLDVEVTQDGRSSGAVAVEITCIGKGPIVRAEAQGPDNYAAFDVAYGRLDERLRRHADRRLTLSRKGSPPRVQRPLSELAPEVQPEPAVTNSRYDDEVVLESGPLVVREKAHPATPMSVTDALHAMELVGHDFYLFMDAESSAPSVVYRRRAYDYGLLRLATN